MSQTFGAITLDGDLQKWTNVDRLDLPPRQATDGVALYNAFGDDHFLLAVRSAELAAGGQVDIWINTDRDASTGFQIFGFAGGMENHVVITVNDGVAKATLSRFLDATGTEQSLGPLFVANGSDGIEVAIPRDQLQGNPGSIHLFFKVQNQHIPSDFLLPQFEADSTPRPRRTDPSRRVGIVYSETTARRYFDFKAYSQLVMAAQHQAMMAGVPYDLLTEDDLLELNRLLNYDALIFPFFANIKAENRDRLESVLLEAVHRHGIGVVSAGDLMTNSETGEALPGDPYRAMKACLGVATGSEDGTLDCALVVASADHPAVRGYHHGEVVRAYSGRPKQHVEVVAGVAATVLLDLRGDGFLRPGVVAVEQGGRAVHFVSDRLLGDNDLLFPALRWVVSGGANAVVLQMGRGEALFFARNDMDQAMSSQEFFDVYPPLEQLLGEWKAAFNFVGSHFVDIGNDRQEDGPGDWTDWTRSAPLYRRIIALGNEVGSHSVTHPLCTDLLTAEQFEFEFGESKKRIEENVGIDVAGVAVPGNPERVDTATAIGRFYDYVTGAASLFDAGFPGAFGDLLPSSSFPYFSPNLPPDFTLIEFHLIAPADAEALWLEQFDGLMRFASQPIVHLEWHDYGPTTGTTRGTEVTHPDSEPVTVHYSISMYRSLIERAFRRGVEFVTGADLARRLRAFRRAELSPAPAAANDGTVVTGEGLGTFSLLIDPVPPESVIASVDDWYAYSARRVFLPESGGTFAVRLGGEQTPLTRITRLPMRARLLSLSGDGLALDFKFEGQGTVELALPSGQSFDIQQSSGTQVPTPGGADLIFPDPGVHLVTIAPVLEAPDALQSTAECPV